MYKLAIKESLDKKFKKFQKKDMEMLRLIERKVQDILADPHRFKPLRNPSCRTREEFMLPARLSLSMKLKKKRS